MIATDYKFGLLLNIIQKQDRRLDDLRDHIQTILDEGFGPHECDSAENNLTSLEQKIHESHRIREQIVAERDEAKAELRRLAGKLGDMEASNMQLAKERDEARARAVSAWEGNTLLDTTNRRLEREMAEMRAERDRLREDIADLLYVPPLKIPMKKTP